MFAVAYSSGTHDFDKAPAKVMQFCWLALDCICKKNIHERHNPNIQ